MYSESLAHRHTHTLIFLLHQGMVFLLSCIMNTGAASDYWYSITYINTLYLSGTVGYYRIYLTLYYYNHTEFKEFNAVTNLLQCH